MLIGAGTVIDSETAVRAISVGAKFIISPVYKQDMVKTCLRYNVISVPGVLAPTEALAAYEAGADFTKLSSISRKFSHKPYLCFSTLKDEFSFNEKKEINKLINKNFKIIAMTRLELYPYGLYKRFQNAPFKTPLDLDQLSKNTIKLNIN
ncbi:MAG: bifunctional 4-hydroxy-2-oxoglutarate aldolase/2-dehydro-3-deoxy-phosphogluconate aldolase [Actinobacteria bacterium]|nr:bifunctional 4-hydroxy-2-oxoglutarate aldolase/2-dehydro-3-deoxy-phosphogluconate aldolase [Actinomycetota bacterium]